MQGRAESLTPIQTLPALKHLAYYVIDLIGAFEDRLAEIWNEPRAILYTHYVITLDRIYGRCPDLLNRIFQHPRFPEQVKEWRALKMVDETFTVQSFWETNLFGPQLHHRYRFLPLDTCYFKDLEPEILSLFSDLDEALDGWLIKSENYQALTTILPKFREKVQTIYIDPPFNKDEQEREYDYLSKYTDAVWITLLENRLRLAKDFLRDTGCIFVRCDDRGNMYVRLLLDEIFGKKNFRNELVIAKSLGLFKTQARAKRFSKESERLFFYSKTENVIYNPIFIKRKTPVKMRPWVRRVFFSDDCQDFRIINGEKYYAPKGWKWIIKQEHIDRLLKEGRLIYDQKKKKWRLISFRTTLKDVWMDSPGYVYKWGFITENSEIVLKRVIQATSNVGDLVMDFFLGSGTTTAVAHKLGRKWLGIEMGKHFYDIVLRRMKKVLFYDPSGISKEEDVKKHYNERQAGGFFKYSELEQYEDVVLKRMHCEFAAPAQSRRLLDVLRQVFVGLPAEGTSGYAHLMHLRTQYFEQVIVPRLRQKIKEMQLSRKELLAELYAFFQQFLPADKKFIIPYHRRIYERVSLHDQDVKLTWYTSHLYYVKTDRLFQSMQIEKDGFRFFFDTSAVEHKKANEKRQIAFSFKKLRDDGVFVFVVDYSEQRQPPSVKDVRQAILDNLGLPPDTTAVPSEKTLKRVFRAFERYCPNVDYFICKDARAFLKEQFDLYIALRGDGYPS